MTASRETAPAYDAQTVKVSLDEIGIAHLQFNRPQKANAFNPTLHREMCETLRALDADSRVKTVVISGGQGKGFSAGDDLKEFLGALRDDERAFRQVLADFHLWCDILLPSFPKPTIAMVHGYCMGAAISVVAGCDLAIAADDAAFSTPQIARGFLPGAGLGKALVDTLGLKRALYFTMTGERAYGRRAAEIGLVNESVPGDALMERTWRLARHMARGNVAALRATKEALRQMPSLTPEQGFAFGMAKSGELRLRQASGS